MAAQIVEMYSWSGSNPLLGGHCMLSSQNRGLSDKKQVGYWGIWVGSPRGVLPGSRGAVGHTWACLTKLGCLIQASGQVLGWECRGAPLLAAHGSGRTVCRQWASCERHILVDDGCSVVGGSLDWWGHSDRIRIAGGSWGALPRGPALPSVSVSLPHDQGGCHLCPAPKGSSAV